MSESEDFCCCEYRDINNHRNHLLTCCCNCVDLDEAVENLVKGKKVSSSTKTGLLNTIQDRMRIPWQGGAKQVAFDAILPLFILPCMFLLSAISIIWTVFSFTTVIIFLLLIFNFLTRTIPKTKFFLMWTITSAIILYSIFEFIVIPFLEILVEENIALTLLIIGFVLSTYWMRTNAANEDILNDCEKNNFGKNKSFCSICQCIVPDKDHHCLWFDCCISRSNQCLFISALMFAIAALIYSSNLTLTSVCHPFTLYKTILLPDDCSEVYQEFELGLSFVSAIYSLGLAILLLIILIHQILIISLGITSREWRQLPILHKISLGVFTKRPNTKGLFGNWKRIICFKRSNNTYTYSTLNSLE